MNSNRSSSRRAPQSRATNNGYSSMNGHNNDNDDRPDSSRVSYYTYLIKNSFQNIQIIPIFI